MSYDLKEIDQIIEIIKRTYDRLHQKIVCILSTKDNPQYNEIQQNDSKIIVVNQINISKENFLLFCLDKTVFLISKSDFISNQIQFSNFKKKKAFILNRKIIDIFKGENYIDYSEKKFDDIYKIIKNRNQKELKEIIRCILIYFLQESLMNEDDRNTNYMKSFCSKKEDKIITKDEYIKYSSFYRSTFTVNIAYNIDKKVVMAIKSFNKNDCDSDLLSKRERLFYLNANHPLIPKYYGYNANNETCLFIEYIDGYNLENVNKLKLTKEEKIKIIFEMMICIQYIHNNNLIYRDLKPSNFLIDKKNKSVVLIDFDRVIKFEERNSKEKRSSVFSNLFGAPEVLRGDQFSYEADIYSLGLLIYYILNEKRYKFDNRFTLPDEFTKLQEKCLKCINEEQSMRPTISELIDFFYVEYFSKLDGHISEAETIKEKNNQIHNIEYSEYWVYLAEQNNYYSLLNLAKMYEEGKLVRKNLAKAQKYNSEALKFVKSKIENSNLQRMYNEFRFYNFEDCDEEKLIQYLKRFKFLTYDISDCQNNLKNWVICVEKECIIIKSVQISFINTVLDKFGGVKINVGQVKSADGDFNKVCEYYRDDIGNNDFVKETIKPMSAFLIKRFFYPSYLFNDNRFFTFNFDDNNMFTTQYLSQMLYIHDSEESKNVLRRLFEPIILKQAENLIDEKVIRKKNNEKNREKLIAFNERKLIKLKELDSNDEYSSYLVFHIKSNHIFMIKKAKEQYLNIDKEFFVKKASHECFVPFCGFLKDDNKIVGFVHEYLTNGKTTLSDYVINHSKEINQIRSLIFLIRIFRAFDHLINNNMNFHHIQMSDIILDHNSIPYISYSFPFEKQYNGYSQTQMSSLCKFNGKVIYLLYEHQNYPENEIPQEITKCSPNINNLYKFCIHPPKDTLKFENIEDYIFNEFEFVNFTNYYCLKYNENIEVFDIIFLTNEMVYLLIYMKRLSKTSTTFLDFFNVPQYFLNKKLNLPEMFYLIGYNYQEGFQARHMYDEAEKFYSEAIKIAKEKGYVHTKAYFHMGYLYEKCFENKKDMKKALSYYEIAANNNDLYALLRLGIIYEKGLGVEKNPEKAHDYFIKATNSKKKMADIADIFLQIGEYYYNGKILDQDYEKAIQYLEQSAAKGNGKACYILGEIFGKKLNTKNFEQSKNYYSKAGDLGYSDGYVKLGDFCYYGYTNFVKQNHKEAIKWYEKAKKLKNPAAYYQLAKMHKNGNGVKKSDEESSALYKEYVKIQSKILLNIGLFYENGYGVVQNYEMAEQLYLLATRLNCSSAFYHLGLLYKFGNSANNNQQNDKKYFEEFLKLGSYDVNLIDRNYQNPFHHFINPESYFFSYCSKNSKELLKIAKLYLKDYGIKENCKIAKQYIELACRYNNYNAFYQLGKLYEKGKNDSKGSIEQNYYEAKRNFKMAIKGHNKKALLHLGCLYENGYGCKLNYSKAIRYFNISAKKDYLKAIFELGLVYFNGIGTKIDLNTSEFYFEKCLKLVQEAKSKKQNEKYYYIEYISSNYLALILITQNSNLYKDRIKNYFEPGTLKYHYNYYYLGTANQFLDDNLRMAEHLYQEASNKKFSLALYSLGYLNELQNKTKEAVQCYINASNNENEPLKYDEIEINDKYFEISKTFIICLTNLKLTHYFLSNQRNEDAKTYFVRVFAKLINENYPFIFEIDVNNDADMFSFMRGFIFNCPYFNQNPYQDAEDINKQINRPNLPNRDEERNNKAKEKNENEEKKNKKNEKTKKKDNEDKIKKDKKIVIENPEQLFEFVIQNGIYRNKFQEKINQIIQEMMQRIYTEPYLILFGRMNAQKNIQNISNNQIRSNIDHQFINAFLDP